MKKKYYLAAPYTGTPEQKKYRMKKVNEVASKLMQKGELVMSPLSHGQAISEYGDMPTDYEYWKEMCEWQMSMCNTLLVYKLDGWKKSIGVQSEIQYAKDNGMDILYLDTCESLKDN